MESYKGTSHAAQLLAIITKHRDKNVDELEHIIDIAIDQEVFDMLPGKCAKDKALALRAYFDSDKTVIEENIYQSDEDAVSVIVAEVILSCKGIDELTTENFLKKVKIMKNATRRIIDLFSRGNVCK